MSDFLRRMRDLADRLPPGSSITLAGAWLREQLEDVPPDGAVLSDGDLTIAQLATRFGRAPSTVRAWIEAKRFPGAYKLRGREWRVPPAAIAAFTDAERRQPPAVRAGHATASKLSDWRKAG